MAGDAFDLAERFQTIVFVMSDLDLGMNNWMSDPFSYPEKPLDRGKVLGKEDFERLGGSGHNEKAQYTERPDDYERNMERLNRKFETARSHVPRPVVATGKSKI